MPRHFQPSLFAYLLFALWLEIGYSLCLVALAGRSLDAAAWQAAVCIAALLPLLHLVLNVLGLPKQLRWRLPRVAAVILESLATLAQVVLPWAGWAFLVWLLNGGTVAVGPAMRAGGGIAGFSYLTGLAVVLIWRTRPSDVVVTQLEVPVRDLPKPFDGYRVLHISDIHANGFSPPARVEERLSPTKDLRPDLVVFTGDLADRRADRLNGAAQAIARLTARDGAVAVLGNHDHWGGEERVRSALVERGVTVLQNEHIMVQRGGESIYIAGVSDSAYSRRDDLGRALEGIPGRAVVLLLSHAPDIVRKPLAGRAALVLAGHTHGGQVVLPLVGPVCVPSRVGRRWASGLHRANDGWLFVTRGLGEVFPPFRLACPPEIALITLRREED